MVINTGTSYQSSTITTQKMEEEYLKSVECGLKANPIMKCWKNNCGLRVVDNLFADEDIIKLHRIVQKGLGTRQETGGPSILDLNTGYVRDSNGLVNLFASDQEIYTPEDFNHYGDIINRLKQHVMETFQLEELYFTAPTFITRLDGRKEWNPQSK